MKVKRLFKYAMSCMLFLMAIFTVTEVHAEQYTGQAIWPSEYISNIYIKKARPDGYTKYQQARFIRRSEDNAFVYCVQPYTDIDNNLPYYNVERSDYARVLGFSDAQWERISLLAYYGYGYEGHSDQKWYAITQVMIWRTTNPESDIYFTDTLNGNRVSRFDGEMAELESLVANHYKAPRFQDNIVMPIGSTITLNDSNNVLSNFRVAGATNVNASVNGNTLTVTATKVGDATINLQKSATKYELPPIVYFKDGSQNVFRVGNYDPVRTNLKIKVVGGKVTPEKYDVETKTKQAQGEATLDGAIYGIYKIDGTKIGTVSSNTTSNYLPELGRFYLLEEKASTGYTLDSNKYYFEITEDNLTPTVKVYEQVIRRDFEITKVYATDETTIMTPEVGVKFGVYNRNGVLVGEYTTNNQGNFEFNLPYGSYTVKQLTSTSGHEKMKDFNIEVKEVGGVIKKVISNAEITAKLRVVKIDAETKEVIKRAGIKFKILDTKTNEYVCQTTSYPKQKICVFETDENGEFITAYPLNTGTYKLEEVDQVIDGYLWNKESHEFTIDENSVLREDSEYGIIFDTQFENTPVKGEVKIEKVGEDRIGPSTYIKEYFKAKGELSPAYIAAASCINAPNETRGGIMSTFRTKTRIFSSQESLSEMLSYSDFDIRDIGKEKTAIFLKVHDEKTTYHALATIFVKQAYEALIATAQTFPNLKLPYRTNFILDEFANMPAIKDIGTMITASRSRNIRFSFAIQNFSQLNQVYGKEVAETIKGNCGNFVYIMSTELAALEEISKLLGDQKPDKPKKDEPVPPIRPLFTVSDLQALKENEVIFNRFRSMPYKTKLTPNWKINWGRKYEKMGYSQRPPHEVKVFDLKDFVQKLKEKQGVPIGAGMPGGFGPSMSGMMGGGMPNPFANPGPIPGGRGSSSGIIPTSLDDYVRKLDEKIAELEREEAEEKARQEKEKQALSQGAVEQKEVVKEKTQEEIQKEMNDIFNHNLKGITSEEDKNTQQPTYENLDKPKVNIDVDSVVVKNNNNDDDFFDDFFGSE